MNYFMAVVPAVLPVWELFELRALCTAGFYSFLLLQQKRYRIDCQHAMEAGHLSDGFHDWDILWR